MTVTNTRPRSLARSGSHGSTMRIKLKRFCNGTRFRYIFYSAARVVAADARKLEHALGEPLDCCALKCLCGEHRAGRPPDDPVRRRVFRAPSDGSARNRCT
jgi:hypothetical protein